jgi:hypothetical protein
MKTEEAVYFILGLLIAALIGLLVGRQVEYARGWKENRRVFGQFYVGGDLRGWSKMEVELANAMYDKVSEELDILREKNPISSHAWGFGLGVDREDKRPVIIFTANPTFESSETIVISYFYTEEMAARIRIKEEKLGKSGLSWEEFVETAIGDDAKIAAKKLYEHFSKPEYSNPK